MHSLKSLCAASSSVRVHDCMDEDSSSKAFPGGKLLLYVQNRAARFARAANGAPLTKSTSSSWSQNHIDFEPLPKAWTRGRISGEMYRSLLLNRFLPLTELDHFEVSPLTSLVKVTCTSDCYCTPAQILRDVLPTTKKMCLCVLCELRVEGFWLAGLAVVAGCCS